MAKAQRGTQADELFSMMDKNSDGKVTADEVPEARRPCSSGLIRRGDKDKDGALSREEFMAVFSRDRPEQSKPDGGPASAWQFSPLSHAVWRTRLRSRRQTECRRDRGGCRRDSQARQNSDGSVTFDEITSQTSEADGNGKP